MLIETDDYGNQCKLVAQALKMFEFINALCYNKLNQAIVQKDKGIHNFIAILKYF